MHQKPSKWGIAHLRKRDLREFKKKVRKDISTLKGLHRDAKKSKYATAGYKKSLAREIKILEGMRDNLKKVR